MQIPLAMMNRHGLVAGATGTGKTKTLQVMAEQLSAAGVPVFVADVKGDVSGLAAPGEAGGGAEKRMAELGLTFEPGELPGRAAVARRHRPRRARARDRLGLRAAAAGQGARRQRDAGVEPGARLPLRRREGPAAARPRRPARAADLPGLRRRARPSSRASAGCRRRRSACCCARSSALETGGGNELFGEPQLDVADLLRVADRRARRHLLPGARGGAGQAEAVLDRADVAARRAVRDAARGRRPAQAQARVLLRRGAPAVRRRDRGVPGRRRADRAADPLQGRRRVLRHPDARRTCRATCSASSATASSTRCAPSRPTTPRR